MEGLPPWAQQMMIQGQQRLEAAFAPLGWPVPQIIPPGYGGGGGGPPAGGMGGMPPEQQGGMPGGGVPPAYDDNGGGAQGGAPQGPNGAGGQPFYW
ncbi:hypothetical protein VTO42DRAFT_5426 [Malbranchea cinnamomea]